MTLVLIPASKSNTKSAHLCKVIRPYTLVKAKHRWKNLESIGIYPVLPAQSVFYIMIQKSVIGARIWFKYKTINAHAISRLYGSTSCCISHGPCQWERAIFDPPQLRDPWTDFHET